VSVLDLARRLTPELAWDLALRAVSSVYGFHGDYGSFAEAQALCGEGYDTASVARAATRALKAELEQSGALELPSAHGRQMAAVGSVLARSGAPLKVLDIGGAWGKHFFECRRLFGAAAVAAWHVVETPKLVDAVTPLLSSMPALRLHASTEGLDLRQYSLGFASSSLQYLPDPEDLLARVCEIGIPFLLIDRLGVIEAERHRITIQTVPPWIHAAKHPAWFFSRERLSALWRARGYEVVVHWPDPDDRPFLDGKRLTYRR
jgi:putative methyltransferase (TIGR04325 family)